MTSKDDNNNTQKGAAGDAEGTTIVGAGLAGLATAIALRNIAGVQSIRLIERFTTEELGCTTAGAGVMLGPNGLRALRLILGEELVDRIYSEGTRVKGNVLLLPDQNMKIPEKATAESGLPEVMIPWAALRRILLDFLPSDCAVTADAGRDIVGYSPCQHEGRDAVELVHSSSSPTTILDHPAPLLVAADGIYSTFQALIDTGDCVLPAGGEEEARRKNIKDGGRLNIKAVVPVDLGPEFEDGKTYAAFSSDGIACFAGPAGKGFTYWAISIPDQKGEEENDDGPAEKRSFLTKEEIMDKDVMKARLIAKLRDLNDDKCQFAIDLIEKTEPLRFFAARSEERENVGPSLVSKDGLVVLTGDAAHSMSPSYGQAANFAFEDAAVLAICIRDGDDLKGAMAQYSNSRIERCVEMQRLSVERLSKRVEPEEVSKWIWDFQV